MDPLLTAVMRIAGAEVGVREEGGKNRGPRVDEYIRAAGLDPKVAAYSWCVCFLQWAFKEAAKFLLIPTPLRRTASVHGLWQRTDKRLRQNVPQPGSIFLIDHGHGTGHAGLVESVEPELIMTIEANTSPSGSREGDGVYRRTRKFDEINLGYLRFTGFVKPKGLVA